MNILTLGAIVCDIAIKPVPKDAFEKRRITLDSLHISGGGDANNAASDLAILGENVRIVSRVGTDFIGDHLLSELEGRGVDTRYVRRDENAETTAAVLALGADGVTTLSTRHNGACDEVAEADVTDEALDWADHLHVVNVLNMPKLDGEGLGELFRRAHEKGVTTSMDLKRPRNVHEHPMDCVIPALANCDVFSPSDMEVEYLLGTDDPAKAREAFSGYGLKVFVMKRGAQGVYVTDFNDEFYLPTLYEGEVVDVTGAGDAFSSTFAAAWRGGAERGGASLRDAALLASSASAHVLSMVGTTVGMRDRKTLEAYVAAHAGK